MPKRIKSSRRWLGEHEGRVFAECSRAERSRAECSKMLIPQVEFMHADFGGNEVLRQLLHLPRSDRSQLAMPDTAPNISGMADVEHRGLLHLLEPTLNFARHMRPPGGDFLVKALQGRDFSARP